MNGLKKKLRYYFGISYSRKLLDNVLNRKKHYFHGSVLDIGGGRKRGKFMPSKTEKWIFADLDQELHPDVICNVEKMQFENDSFDTIKATQLFEHVENPENGIRECYRVLKKGGHFIISAPFIYPIHADPYDFQRWTDTKWKNILTETGFEIEEFYDIGKYFTVLIDMFKNFNQSLPSILRYIGYIFYPLYSLLIQLDKTNFVLRNNRLNKYTAGYFIIAKK